MTTELVELAACPFCSAGASLTSNGHENYYIECHECGASGPAQDTSAEAITAWNTRALASRAGGLDSLAGFPVVVNPYLPPDGFVLVPREPTDDMVWAGRDAWREAHDAMNRKMEQRKPMTETWAAMLAAAPEPVAVGSQP